MKHHRAGALYMGTCKKNWEENTLNEYWGEIVDSAYSRGLDHLEDVLQQKLPMHLQNTLMFTTDLNQVLLPQSL